MLFFDSRAVTGAFVGVGALITAGMACLAFDVSPAPVLADGAPIADVGSCRFHLPRQVHTIAYDIYGGDVPSKFRRANAPYAYLGCREIRVPKREAPLLLVLNGHAAAEWDLHIEPGAEIAAIFVMGYDSQIVSHVPEGVPVAFSTQADGPGDECPRPIEGDGGKLWSSMSAMLSQEFSRQLNEMRIGSVKDCSYVGCRGVANATDVQTWGSGAAKPVSTWARVLGAKVDKWDGANRPGGTVHASAGMVVRGRN